MWEIITSRDFLLNLAAGGVIFVLEVVLIVMLLPLFLQRRLDKRWKPVREAIARAFDRSVAQYVGAVKIAARRSENKKMGIEEVDMLLVEVHQELLEKFSTYSAALTPELARRSAALLDVSRGLTRSISIEVALGDDEALSTAVGDFKLFTSLVDELVSGVGLTDRIIPHGLEADKDFVKYVGQVRANGLYHQG